MARTTAVTLPDGTIATRTSKTRTYEWAVVKTTDNRAKADRLRVEADAMDVRRAQFEAIIASGDLTQLVRRVTSSNGRGEKFYGSYLPGDPKDAYSLPDHTTDAWAKHLDATLRHLIKWANVMRDQAEALGCGPEDSYEVVRWSSRRDLADKALGEFWLAPEQSMFVVPCRELVKGAK